MEIYKLLSELEKHKVVLRIEEGKLKVDVPKGVSIGHLIDEIKKRKEEIIEMHKNIRHEKQSFIQICEQKEYYPLSPAQKRMYLLQQFDLTSTVYNMPYIIPLGKKLDIAKIEEVFQELISHYESLRTSFVLIGEEPVQKISENFDFCVKEFTVDKQEEQHIHTKFIQAFDLSRAPLLRVAVINIKGGDSLLLIDMHHIISDGTSHAILEREFRSLYSGESLAPLSLQYKDYSQWQNSEEQQIKVKEQENFWLRKFEGEIPVLNLPTDYVRPAIKSNDGAKVRFVLSKVETKIIKRFIKENDLSLYMSILSIFTIFLSKLSGQYDIVVGTPIAGRNHSDLKGIVGMFVNTLVIRNEVNGNNTLKNFLRKLKQSTFEAFENQDYQFEALVEKISLSRDVGRNPIFDVMFNLLNQAEYRADLTGLDNKNYIHTSGISKFDLTLTAVDYGDQLMLSFEYCTQLFKAETIDRFIRYFKQIVSQISQNTERKLSELEIINAEEKQQLLYSFNDTEVSYPSQKSIAQVFNERVEEFSKKIALEDKDKSYTYQELDEESNKIANYLIKNGIAKGQLIGLMAGRSSDMIIGILGILKTGGAYVPIDPAYPKERVDQLIQDSGINLVLTTEQVDFECNLSEGIIHIRDKEIKDSSSDFALPSITSSSIAYVMYTSGSTGTPKGVVIEQKSVLRLVQNNQFFPFHSEQKILLTGAPVFDATTFEIWGALLNGGNLYIASNEVIINSVLLSDCIRKNNITSLWLTSPLFNQLIDQDEELFDTLKYLLVGGDVLSVKHINKIKSRNSELVLINGYGPTENTTFSTTFKIEKEYEGNIPIGKPISNSTAYILDKSNKLQAVGVPGELLVGGDGLAREYLNNPKLTREKFIENPFKQGERLYKTGDLARWLPDGNIEFLGRLDHQVKIRGFRIELGEIENTLLKHDQIKESVVIDIEENGEKYLCAYLVIKEDFNQEEIRTHLSESLPDYMIPSFFVELEKLPLTSNGKVNRNALPEPEIVIGDDFLAPRNEIEDKLTHIWSEVLGIEVEKIGIRASFFELGGHSLRAINLISKIHKEFEVIIPLMEVFKNQKLEDLALYILSNVNNQNWLEIFCAEKKEFYNTSLIHKRLYFLQELHKSNTNYNEYREFVIEGMDLDIIENIFKQLINRHESLRSSFFYVDGEIVQKVHNELEFKIDIYDDIEFNETNSFIKPFALDIPPLIRVSFIKTKKQSKLLIEMHHIITDGISMAILEREFFELFKGEKLKKLKIQTKDYIEYLSSEKIQLNLKLQEKFWLDLYGSTDKKMQFPYDIECSAKKEISETLFFYIEKDIMENIENSIKINGVNRYFFYFSIYCLMLYKVCNTKNIIVGTIVSGRRHVDLDDVVGMFVNTLALKIDIESDLQFSKYLKMVANRVAACFDNQLYDFNDLLENLNLKSEKEAGSNPLFDSLFLCYDQDSFNLYTKEDNVISDENRRKSYKSEGSKFDFVFNILRRKSDVEISISYRTDLFKRETVERMYFNWCDIINIVTEKNDILLSSINTAGNYNKIENVVFNDDNVAF